jgi:small subunit ribosomal protein S9
MSDETPQEEVPETPADAETPVEETPAAPEEPVVEAEDEKPAAKPAIPGMDLELDLVEEGSDPLNANAENVDPYALSEEPALIAPEDESPVDEGPIAAEIKLAADARYRATGKRKTAVARVTLKPGTGEYTINGRTLAEFFPRDTLQRNIRQPLETVGYEAKMDVVARIHGGGVSSQGGALRHGISRALLEADPNLRGELKRRGFLTRDSRVKERKKAGLKKARKKPQFSKR